MKDALANRVFPLIKRNLLHVKSAKDNGLKYLLCGSILFHLETGLWIQRSASVLLGLTHFYSKKKEIFLEYFSRICDNNVIVFTQGRVCPMNIKLMVENLEAHKLKPQCWQTSWLANKLINLPIVSYLIILKLLTKMMYFYPSLRTNLGRSKKIQE